MSGEEIEVAIAIEIDEGKVKSVFAPRLRGASPGIDECAIAFIAQEGELTRILRGKLTGREHRIDICNTEIGIPVVI